MLDAAGTVGMIVMHPEYRMARPKKPRAGGDPPARSAISNPSMGYLMVIFTEPTALLL
jgi:hypothetical protein